MRNVMFEIAGQLLSLFQSFSLGFDQNWNIFTFTIAPFPSNTGTGCLPPEVWVIIASYLQLEEQAIFYPAIVSKAKPLMPFYRNETL